MLIWGTTSPHIGCIAVYRGVQRSGGCELSMENEPHLYGLLLGYLFHRICRSNCWPNDKTVKRASNAPKKPENDVGMWTFSSYTCFIPPFRWPVFPRIIFWICGERPRLTRMFSFFFFRFGKNECPRPTAHDSKHSWSHFGNLYNSVFATIQRFSKICPSAKWPSAPCHPPQTSTTTKTL